MAHDVFICYASEDKVTANAACARLEAAGIRCWIAPRDPIAGIPYGRQLIDAITNTRVVLLVFSGNANHSEHVLRELEVASDANKVIVPFRIEEVAPSGDLRYYITRVHWLDALTPPLEHRLDELLTLIQRLLEIPTTELLEMPGRKMPPSPAQRAAKRKSASPLMTGLVGALSAVVVIGLIAALASAMHSPGTAPRVAALPTRHKPSSAHRAHRAPPKVALRPTTPPTPVPTVPPRAATPAPTEIPVALQYHPVPQLRALPLPPPVPTLVQCAASTSAGWTPDPECEAMVNRDNEAITGAQDFNASPRELATALQFFRDSAAVGDADAETWIGYMYETGMGEPQSYAQALYWYQRAVAGGNFSTHDYAVNAVKRVQQILSK